MIKLGFLIVFIGAFFVIIYFVGKKRFEEKKIIYQKLAKQWGLSMVIKKEMFSSKVQMEGMLYGVPVEVYEEQVSDGDDGTTTYTHITFKKTSFPFGFKIRKEGFFNKIGRKLGFRDIEFGKKDLDDVYNFSADNEDYFRALINEEMQQKIMAVRSVFRGVLKCSYGKFDYRSEAVLVDYDARKEFKVMLFFMGDLLKADSNLSDLEANEKEQKTRDRNSYK